MIYHICPPDKLFVYQAIRNFELIKANYNKCIIIVSSHHKSSQSNIDKKYIEYCGSYNNTVINLINDSQCKGIVLHTLNEDLLNLVLSLKKDIPILWRSWGADLHDILYTKFDPFEHETKKITSRNIFLESIIALVRPFYHFIKDKNKIRQTKTEKKILFFERINFISTVTKSEYENLIQKVTSCKAKAIPLNYNSIGLQIPKSFLQNKYAKGIMIGHSSFSYHNHADTFKILQKMGDHSSKLIVPLNYGSQKYANTISHLGYEIFKDRFIPIFEYMQFDEYLKTVNDCFAFILNSKIQSGGANISYFLLQGSKVYLHEENPIYQDYKKLGYRIFSVQKDLTYEHLYNYQLSEEEKTINYKLKSEVSSRERVTQNTLKIYQAFNIKV